MFRFLPNFTQLFKGWGKTPIPNSPIASVREEGDPTPLDNNILKNNMLNAVYTNSNNNARIRPMYNKFRNNLAQKTSTTRNSINLTFNKYKNLRNTRGLNKFWNNAEAARGDEIYGEVYDANNGNNAYSESNEADDEERNSELNPQTLRVSGGRRCGRKTSKRSTKRRRNGRSSRTRR